MMYIPITTTKSPALSSLVLATTLLSLFTSPTSAQQFFHISPFYAQDGSWITDTPEDIDHSLTFNISRPGAAGTQGGNGEAECRFSWYVIESMPWNSIQTRYRTKQVKKLTRELV